MSVQYARERYIINEETAKLLVSGKEFEIPNPVGHKLLRCGAAKPVIKAAVQPQEQQQVVPDEINSEIKEETNTNRRTRGHNQRK